MGILDAPEFPDATELDGLSRSELEARETNLREAWGRMSDAEKGDVRGAWVLTRLNQVRDRLRDL